MENQTPLQIQIQALQTWANNNLFPKYASPINQSEKYFDEVQELSNLVQGKTIAEIRNSPELLSNVKDELGDVLVTALMFAAITEIRIAEIGEPVNANCNFIKLLNNAHVSGALQVNTIIALCNNFAFTYGLGELSEILQAVNGKLSKRQLSDGTACWFHDTKQWRFIKEKDFHKYTKAEACVEYYKGF